MKKFKTIAITLLALTAATNLFCLSINSNNQKCRNLLSRMLSFNIPAYAEGPGAGIFGPTTPYEILKDGVQHCKIVLKLDDDPIEYPFSLNSVKTNNLTRSFGIDLQFLPFNTIHWTRTIHCNNANKGVRIDSFDSQSNKYSGVCLIDVKSVGLYKIGCRNDGGQSCEYINNPCQKMVNLIESEFSPIINGI